MFILASASPRRAQLLRCITEDFLVRPVDCDEDDGGVEVPQRAERIARQKAELAREEARAEDIVIAADTLVVCEGEVLGKPHDEADARRMLGLLSGRAHTVYTGVAVSAGGQTLSFTSSARVLFRRLNDAQIAGYIATGEPMDKAGAYGIQGKGALLVRGIEGDYYTVMGLPLCELRMVLETLGLVEVGTL